MKKAIALFLSILFLMTVTFSQTIACKYCADLDYLISLLKQTPSYKAQIKGDKQIEFDKLTSDILAKLQNISTTREAFSQLSRVITTVNDNHLFFYENPVRKDLSEHPKVTLDLTALEKKLSKKSINQVEGIYFSQDFLKIGVYQTAEKNHFEAIILESKAPAWRRGEIAFYLEEYAPNRFRASSYSLDYKTLRFYQNEKYQNGRLIETRCLKKKFNYGFSDYPKDLPVFDFKVLSEKIQYLRLGSFYASDEDINKIHDFYTKVSGQINAPNLIVDIRNNGGGGFKASGKFLKLLKDYAKKAKIYLLINAHTVSNAEEFAVELKKEKNVTVLGETSRGTITYGSNYGTTENLPSGEFRFYPTDMFDLWGYLKYENIGVTPEVTLNFDSDWVKQTVGMIKKTK